MSSHQFYSTTLSSLLPERFVPVNISQLSAMDASARVTMKDAAKCDKHCELQNSVNQQNFERTLRLWATPEGMSASESPIYSFHQAMSGLGSMLCASAAKVLAHQEHQFVRRTPTRCSALRLLLGLAGGLLLAAV